jgi:hypothetical protein
MIAMFALVATLTGAAVQPLLEETVAQVAAPSAYLCLVDAVGGLAFDKDTKTWRGAPFNGTGDKYIFRRLTPEDQALFVWGKSADDVWGLFPFGENRLEVTCDSDFNKSFKDKPDTLYRPTDYLFCGGDSRFIINRSSLRLQYYVRGGYMYPEEETSANGPDTPVIVIGRCSPVS